MSDPEIENGEAVEEFAIVEVFGHRRHAGRIAEVERFGAKFLRIDIPIEGTFTGLMRTLFYGGASIFSMTLCDKKTAERQNVGSPPSRLEYEPDEDEDFSEVDEP